MVAVPGRGEKKARGLVNIGGRGGWELGRGGTPLPDPP